MSNSLKHSHIAVEHSLGSFAENASSVIGHGEDDLGPFSYFDLILTPDDEAGQRVRYASHAGDKMVHLLAEDITNVHLLAAALYCVGARSSSVISISTDQNGLPLRDISEIKERIGSFSRIEGEPLRQVGRPRGVGAKLSALKSRESVSMVKVESTSLASKSGRSKKLNAVYFSSI